MAIRRELHARAIRYSQGIEPDSLGNGDGQRPNAGHMRLSPTYRVGLPQAKGHRLLVRYAVPAARWSRIVDG
jgi:hypothetical protein